MKKNLTVKKDRNPFVAQMKLRKSGPHIKSAKAERALAKVKLKKDI